ncbi:hypothetical protein DIURU_005798 [Diutina rugosa]|uniref:Transcription factor Pcc1 n=1 Tax=Diutina rugosa TaxID=5481 RepID=A0A642UG58_DIURU|nr:uncharacterized protein DIURU_005798 [Diutina rugosa]KAA8896426.1 hypothetical protein DIURU_005798 [Diutina rugosa]
MSLDYKLELRVPFETARQAEIAYNSLIPDPVLKGNEININYSVDNNELVANFAGVSDKMIRVAISNTIDNIKVIIETMDAFDGKKDQTWSVEAKE